MNLCYQILQMPPEDLLEQEHHLIFSSHNQDYQCRLATHEIARTTEIKEQLEELQMPHLSCISRFIKTNKVQC